MSSMTIKDYYIIMVENLKRGDSHCELINCFDCPFSREEFGYFCDRYDSFKGKNIIKRFPSLLLKDEK